MFKKSVLFACFTSLLMLLSPPPISSKSHCEPSCGNLHNITYPFRLKGDPSHCGLKEYEFSCDENNRTILQWHSGRFYVVMAVNYTSSLIRVVDPGIQKDNCSAWPLYSSFSTSDDPYILSSYNNKGYTFLNCSIKVKSSGYIDTAVCSNTSENTSFASPLLQTHHTYVVSSSMPVSDVEDSCTIGQTVWASNQGPEVDNTSFRSIHDGLAYGFELYYRWTSLWAYCYFDDGLRFHCWSNYKCFSRTPPFFIGSSFRCIWNVLRDVLSDKFYLTGDGTMTIYTMDNAGNHYVFGYQYFFIGVSVYIALAFAARAVCGIPFFFAFLVYKWRRRHFSMYANIENFIQSHNNLTPVRYSYSDIKKMTKGFKDKLGEGGYGCVYKGKLRSGQLVAVKILGNSKANGQDFINEVATIGRIHHVNVVQLIGFCVERSKRALVYDFMPNGSLEKYILPREEGNFFLSCEKLYEISLGIAYGIEYLHRGCDMQILHFDIKPHNILLDNKFIPKVSDFGLAKLYPANDSIVNLTAARGTMGYMAPELFYKNIGGVSYKADVYSFGMLLMEMASKRKNLNPFVEHLSQIYFPSWVYDQFNDGNDIEMGDATEEERKIVMKMIIVALWCIQMKPTDRPSMSKVVEMLEGNVELLGMPPKPLLYPQEMSIVDQANNNIPAGAPASSLNAMDTITLDGQ